MSADSAAYACASVSRDRGRPAVSNAAAAKIPAISSSLVGKFESLPAWPLGRSGGVASSAVVGETPPAGRLAQLMES